MFNNYVVDIHAIQSLPPSNLNRDETGSPKTATFGNVRRARVSSQAWKAAMRKWFKENLDLDNPGIRTKHVPQMILEEILNRGIGGMTEKQSVIDMKDIMSVILPKKKDKNKQSVAENTDKITGITTYQTDALFMVSRRQIQRVVDIKYDPNLNDKERVKQIQNALNEDQAMDTSLFGRMVADAPNINVDAGVQVAHALGVTKAIPEFDFYTAMDDERDRVDHSGSSMMGTIEFSSSVLYRYADLSLSQLLGNLGGNVPATIFAVQEFLRAFIKSMPSGKQNTFAAHTLPDAVIVTIRPGRPVSYVEAFENPIEGGSPTIKAIDTLVDYAEVQKKSYGLEEVATYVVAVRGADRLSELGEVVGLQELISKVGDTIRDDVFHYVPDDGSQQDEDGVSVDAQEPPVEKVSEEDCKAATQDAAVIEEV